MADALTAENVSVERGKRTLLRQVSLSAREGELLAIVGPNGAGKSTLLKALLGVLPHTGKVSVGQTPLAALSPRERARALAYVPQRSELGAGISVHDVVAQARYARHGGMLGFGERRDDVVDGALARVGLAPLAERAYDTLSGGEQRRVLTARALASGARLLLLDEPTAGLDLPGREAFLERLDALAGSHPELAVVQVSHHLEELAGSTTHALLLTGGAVVAAGAADRVLREEPLSRCFGAPVRLARAGGRLLAVVERH
jgi:iron complex transport system ATP-binding protein